MELLLIRHALPQRVETDDGSPADPRLAALGHQQAAALAAWLADERIDAIYTSPLRRAVETAAPLAAAHGLTPVVEDGVAEWDRAADAYIPIEELRATDDPRWAAMVAGDWSYGQAVPVDPVEFARTVVTSIEGIVDRHPGQQVAVVAHGGIVNVYTARVLGTDRFM
ncbi:MAG: 2,3-bisphosphoglycerate-dependent phosphoglycerate mutase, partial [Nocardioidaceae bacterium]|nr:2,3-bisphosphoglycerate-dependent phosphoglycerate mutase [Nocardioidaceae bacterium]